MDRKDRLLRGLPKESKVIEIGPSYNPLAPRQDGWNTVVVDHADREGLVAKYAADPAVDVAAIEEVDVVWIGGPLTQAVPEHQHGTFDAFVASHVIEHATDVVAFLRSAQTLIKDDGVVVLAVPDKRKCFDFYRPVSTTADAIVAFEEKRARHDRRTHFDHGMYTAVRGNDPGWGIGDTRPMTLNNTIERGWAYMNLAGSETYVDAHTWIFVPASFELMVLELASLGLLDLRAESVVEAAGTEFYAWLRKGAEPIDAAALHERRRLLLDRMIVELAEQSRQIPGSPLALADERAREAAAVAALPRKRRAAGPLGWLSRPFRRSP